MSVTFGPSTWWLKSKEAADYYARICPVGTVLGDGSTLYCRAGGQAWILIPHNVRSYEAWAGGRYNTTCVSNIPSIQMCCICEWPGLCSNLISKGFNPCDWFVPSSLYNTCLGSLFAGYSTFGCYYTAAEESCCRVPTLEIYFNIQYVNFIPKSCPLCVYAIRCITL